MKEVASRPGSRHGASPFTQAPARPTDLVSNLAVRAAADAFRAAGFFGRRNFGDCWLIFYSLAATAFFGAGPSAKGKAAASRVRRKTFTAVPPGASAPRQDRAP